MWLRLVVITLSLLWRRPKLCLVTVHTPEYYNPLLLLVMSTIALLVCAK